MLPETHFDHYSLLNHIQVCYGTTETSPVSFMSIRDDLPEDRIKSVGFVMDHLEVT